MRTSKQTRESQVRETHTLVLRELTEWGGGPFDWEKLESEINKHGDNVEISTFLWGFSLF